MNRPRAKIVIAVAGSAAAHLVLVGAAIGIAALSGLPDNDDFVMRERLGEVEKIEVRGSSFAATRESGEPHHGGQDPAAGIAAGHIEQGGSVWFSWRAPADANDVLVEIEMPEGTALSGSYQGYAVDKLEEVATSSNGTMTFPVEPGEDYHIAIATAASDGEKKEDDEGDFNLRIQSFSKEDSEEMEILEDSAVLLPDFEIEKEKKPFSYVRTTQNDRAKQAPGEPAFESDRDTEAASELSAKEGAPSHLPSQAGEDIPDFELADRDDVDGEIVEDANLPIPVPNQPMAAELLPTLPTPVDPLPAPQLVELTEVPQPVETTIDAPLVQRTTSPDGNIHVGEEKKEEAEKPEETKGSEESETPKETVDKTDPPKAEPAKQPSPAPRPGTEKAVDPNVFQPQTRRNRIDGGVQKKGQNSVDAAETARGRYHRKVIDAVEKSWHKALRRKFDYSTFGSIKISYIVNANGKAEKLRIIEDSTTPLVSNLTLEAILKAKIPPIPKEVIDGLGGTPYAVTQKFLFY